MNRVISLVLGFCISSYVLSAQNNSVQEDIKPLIALLPFSYSGIEVEDNATIENLVYLYLEELEDFTILDRSDRERIFKEHNISEQTVEPDSVGQLLDADFLIDGSLRSVEGSISLDLELIKVRSGETLQFSSLHKNIGDLVLGTRALVRQLLDKGWEQTASEEQESEIITEERIIGTWQGDRGIELIRLYRGGSGLAIMRSGAMMELQYTIENNTVLIRQTSDNTERFYHPVPYSIARQLVEAAQPMEWRLQLYNKGSLLKGTKISTAVMYEQDNIIELIHNNGRPAEWQKMTR